MLLGVLAKLRQVDSVELLHHHQQLDLDLPRLGIDLDLLAEDVPQHLQHLILLQQHSIAAVEEERQIDQVDRGRARVVPAAHYKLPEVHLSTLVEVDDGEDLCVGIGAVCVLGREGWRDGNGLVAVSPSR